MLRSEADCALCGGFGLWNSWVAEMLATLTSSEPFSVAVFSLTRVPKLLEFEENLAPVKIYPSVRLLLVDQLLPKFRVT